MRWRADALEGRCAGGPILRICESVRRHVVPHRPTPQHRLAKSRTELMRLNINNATLMRLRHWKKPPDFQTVTAIPPRLRISDSAHRRRAGWPVGQCGDRRPCSA